MPDRRQFLQAAAAVSAAPAMGAAAHAGGGRLAVGRVIYDERHAAGRAFGRAAMAWGASVSRIRGDVTPLWSQTLHREWRSAPSPIAGLTPRSSLFCLEQLAWDAGMRVVFLAEHRTGEAGPVRHDVKLGDARAAADIDSAGARWGEQAARTLLELPAGALSARGPAEASMEARLGDDASLLVSWVIAPAAGASKARAV